MRPQTRGVFERHQFSPAIRSRLRELATDRNNSRALAALLADVVIIGVSITSSIVFPLAYPFAVIAIGTRQRALANLVHDATHRSLARTRWIERLIGTVAGWLVFQTMIDYRTSHVRAHHAFFGDENRDPDLKNYRDLGLYETRADKFVSAHLPGALLGPRGLRRLGSILKRRILLVGWFTRPKPERREYVAYLAFWLIGFGALVQAGLGVEFLLFWLVPFATVYQAIDWLTEVAEHFPLTKLHRSELLVTRNRRGNWFERALTGTHHESWHLVHHLQPAIPSWNLRKAHEILCEDHAYRSANELCGGLFTRGPNGEPSILSQVGPQLAQAQLRGEL